MNPDHKKVLGILLNVSGSTFSGSCIALSFIHGLPLLLLFAVGFLGLAILGIFVTRSAEKERNRLFLEKALPKIIAQVKADIPDTLRNTKQ
jgi:hypothetical protein